MDFPHEDTDEEDFIFMVTHCYDDSDQDEITVDLANLQPKSSPSEIDQPKSPPLEINQQPENSPLKISHQFESSPLEIDQQPENSPLGVDQQPENSPLGVDQQPENSPLGIDQQIESYPLEIDEQAESFLLDNDQSSSHLGNPTDPGGNIVTPIFNFNDNQKSLKTWHGHEKHRGAVKYKGSSEVNARLNNALLCIGKKFNRQKKIAIFNFVLEKLYEIDSGCTITRLERLDLRELANLDNRLREIIPFLEYLKAKEPTSDTYKALLNIVHQ